MIKVVIGTLEEFMSEVMTGSTGYDDVKSNKSTCFCLHGLVNMQVFFEGEIGSQMYSDIAIDDVTFLDGECSVLPPIAEQPTPSAPPTDQPPITQPAGGL